MIRCTLLCERAPQIGQLLPGALFSGPAKGNSKCVCVCVKGFAPSSAEACRAGHRQHSSAPNSLERIPETVYPAWKHFEPDIRDPRLEGMTARNGEREKGPGGKEPTNDKLNHSHSQLARNRFEKSCMIPDDEISRKLPKEILLRILSYLDVTSLCRCGQVSRYWNMLALDGSNWQKIDLFDFQRDIEGPVIENISLRCGGFLKYLRLRGCQSVGSQSIRTLAQHCHNIEHLDLSECKKISDVAIQPLSRHCSKLTAINLESCSQISDSSLKALSDGCPNLTEINVSWCNLITENGVEALARGCNKIKKFSSKGCKQVNDRAVIALALFCPGIEVLNLHSCDSITDASISRIAEKCCNLKQLCVSKCTELTDQSLLALSMNNHYLNTLEVAGCAHFSDNGFTALAKNCKYLERMDLEECSQITDATLGHLAMGCPSLEKLTLSHCELITDEGIRQLAGGGCAAESLSVLELDNCPLITDATLEHLISCHNLQRIELYDCQLISRNAIRRLRNHLPNIKVHAYFAPVTPPPTTNGPRPRYCRCCEIL